MSNKAAYFKPLSYFGSFFLTIAFIVIATVLGKVIHILGISETNIVIVYILFVLLTSRLTAGYYFGIFASIASTFAYNYFFTMPYYTFAVYEADYFITFAIMTITAVITSALTSRIKENIEEVNRNETRTRALYQLTNHLTDAADLHEIAKIATKIISELFGCQVACLCYDEKGNPEINFIQQVSAERQIYREVDDVFALKNAIADLRTAFFCGEEFLDWPIYGHDSILGIVRVPKEKGNELDKEQENLLRAMIESIALAMDRFNQTQQKIKLIKQAEQERYRGDLLRSISHDIRTPLSGIMGTAEILIDQAGEDTGIGGLAELIYQDADWLQSLVENILSLSRLQEGKLVIHKEFEAIEEIIGSALHHITRRNAMYEFKVDIPDEVVMLPMDGRLIMQVLINLLDNAMKHSETASTIEISVRESNQDGYVEINVIDSGKGIDEKEIDKIFEMFYTSQYRSTDMKRGIGLGLTICDAIIKAHGGRIYAHNRQDRKGAIFTFILPKEAKQWNN